MRPIGEVDQLLLQQLRPGLINRFGVGVTTGGMIPIDPEWLDQERAQYRAGPILDAVTEAVNAGDSTTTQKALGIIDADIFAPNLSFIFGQAIVGGCCGIIGLARLRPEFYLNDPDEERFKRRTLIEAVHEIGHMVGLDHCPDEDCVMNFSRDIQDSDRKGPDLCERCQTLILR